MVAPTDPRIRPREPPTPHRPPTLRSGDSVRLKFMYSGGAVEIMDCRWVAVVNMGAEGSESSSPWVVIEFEGRRIWKPLAYLVQAELLEESAEPAAPSARVPARPPEDLGYHR